MTSHTTPHTPDIALDSCGLTDIGKKRPRNEDSLTLLTPPPESPQARYGSLFIVADGMGGLGGGDTASRYALDSLTRAYYSIDNAETDVRTRLTQAVNAANEIVRAQAPVLKLPRIGSTAAGLAVLPDGTICAFNVGDCRVYRYRDGRLDQLTRDQSVTQQQLDSGLITSRQAQQGRSAMVTVFIGQTQPVLPHITTGDLQADDVYLVCSDGLWGAVGERMIKTALRNFSADQMVRILTDRALRAGGVDNISVIAIRTSAPRQQLDRVRLSGIILLVAALLLGILALSVSNRLEFGEVFSTSPSIVDDGR